MPRPPVGPTRRKHQVFYSDPERPGRSRHGTCFPNGISPKRLGYIRTDGPCWVCSNTTFNYVAYKSMDSYIDDLKVIEETLLRVSRTGFELARAIRCNSWECQVSREVLERNCAPLVQKFRQEWREAGDKSHFWDKRKRGVSLLDAQFMANIAYGLVMIRGNEQGLSEFDPRRYFRGSDPSQRPMVQAAQIEQLMGRLGFIANLLLERLQKLRAAMAASHGKDAEESLREAIETHGASSAKVAEAAGAFLVPPNQDLDRIAAALASTLRQRKLTRNHALTHLPASDD